MPTEASDKDLFMNPRSVVFIGVSRNTGPGALNPVENLRSWGYKGTIHIVHPHAQQIAGVNTVPDVASLKDPVDLGIIATPRDTIPGIVRQCAQKGIRALIVTNQGFSEADARGKELQRRMVEAAHSAGTRILGPNTLGVSNAFDGFMSSFMPLQRQELPIGIVCQSGVFFVGSSQFTGGIGMGIDIGNGCDVGLVESIQWFGHDKRIKVLVIHAEGLSGGRRFLDIAREVSLRIPVVAMKTGRSPWGAAAALSHSGAMAGHDRIVDAVTHKTGILRVEETQELKDLAWGFLRLPPLKGKRIAIVTLTGGVGIMLLDAMYGRELTPVKLSHRSIDGLQALSPPWMPISNPMDIWPAVMKNGMRKVYGVALRDVLSDPDVDGVLCVAVGVEREYRPFFSALEEIQRWSTEVPKPIVVWVYGPHADEVRSRIHEQGRAMSVPTLEGGVKLLARMAQYQAWKQANAQKDTR